MRYVFAALFFTAANWLLADDSGTKTFKMADVLIDIPNFLATRDDSGTLVAYPPNTDFANIRVSVISILKDGKGVPNAGKTSVETRAKELGAQLNQTDHKIWCYAKEPSSEVPGSTIHFWYVALDADVVAISLFIDSKEEANPLTERVWKSVPKIIESLRKKGET